MIVIPVTVGADGSISSVESAPSDAICTITTPTGCEVYMPGDEEILANRLSAEAVRS